MTANPTDSEPVYRVSCPAPGDPRRSPPWVWVAEGTDLRHLLALTRAAVAVDGRPMAVLHLRDAEPETDPLLLVIPSGHQGRRGRGTSAKRGRTLRRHLAAYDRRHPPPAE